MSFCSQRMQEGRRSRGRHALRTIVALGWLLLSCSCEGPAGPIPGGPFSGEPERLGPEADWSFATDLDSVDVQVHDDPPRTVRTGIVVYRGTPYLPVTWSALKSWPDAVRREPRVLVRADGRLFELFATEVGGEELDALRRTGQAKYGAPFHARSLESSTYYFRLATMREP